jgi:hypothetical protein
MIHKKDKCPINRQIIRPWAYNSLKRSRWNTVVQYISNNYIVLVIMSLINLQALRFNKDYNLIDRLNSIFALFWCLLSVSFPVIMSVIYCRTIKNRKERRKLSEKDLEAYKSRTEKFDYLIVDLENR